MGLNWNSRKRAFSLLEVVISIAILSVGLMAVLQALSFSARMAGLSCDITNAVFLAEDKMQEMELKEKQNLINKQPRQAKARENKFDWFYVLNSDAVSSLYRLEFNISWQSANRKEGLKLNTYLR